MPWNFPFSFCEAFRKKFPAKPALKRELSRIQFILIELRSRVGPLFLLGRFDT